MFYDVPDCLSATSGIEAKYLEAIKHLADNGSYVGAREMLVRFLNSENVLDLNLSEDFINDELEEYISPETDLAVYAEEALEDKVSEVEDALIELLGRNYVRKNMDCKEVLSSIATTSYSYEEVVDIINKRLAYYMGFNMRTDILASNVLGTTVAQNDYAHNCLTVFSVMRLIKEDSKCEFSTSGDYKDLVVNLYNAIADKKEYTPERYVKCVDCKPRPENFDDIRVSDSFFGLACGLKDKPDNLAGVLMVMSPAVACVGSPTIFENYMEAVFYYYVDQEAAWERLEYIFEVLNATLYRDRDLRGAKLNKGKVYRSAVLVVDVSDDIRCLRDLLTAKKVIVYGVEAQVLKPFADFIGSHGEMEVDIEVLSEDDKTLVVNIVA